MAGVSMEKASKTIEFLTGGGEMGALTRAYDWSKSSLGSPEHWPQSLRLTVRLMLNSGHPMFIWWGPNLIQFYNDAYRQTMGPERHPSALGQPGKECWEEIWHIIGPKIAYVMAGKGSTWDEDQLVPVTRHGKLEDVWWTFSFGPIDVEGEVGGILVVCTDVTKQHQTQEALSQRSKHLEKLFEQAPGFMAIVKGPTHIFELTNATYNQLLGNRNLLGNPVRHAVPEVEGQGFFELLDRVFQTGVAYVGRHMPLKLNPETDDTVQKYIDFVYQPIFEADGTVSGIFVEGHDVTGHVQSEQHLQLMNEELKHRVKNILTVVLAIASQSLRGGLAHLPEVETFRSRIGALAEVDDLLTSSTWASASVGDIVKRALAPYGRLQSQIQMSGPNLVVGSKQTMSLALAIHELATNSLKYGAFATKSGIVNITWTITSSNGRSTFHFTWQEKDGPPVKPPKKLGFGSKLIETALKADFGGNCEIAYQPAGLICTLTAATENLGQGFPQRF